MATAPGNEGTWFATAKELGLFEEVIRLANQAPCDPKTLTRAARDFGDRRLEFATEAGMAGLRWLVEGYGYEITGVLHEHDDGCREGRTLLGVGRSSL